MKTIRRIILLSSFTLLLLAKAQRDNIYKLDSLYLSHVIHKYKQLNLASQCCNFYNDVNNKIHNRPENPPDASKGMDELMASVDLSIMRTLSEVMRSRKRESNVAKHIDSCIEFIQGQILLKTLEALQVEFAKQQEDLRRLEEVEEKRRIARAELESCSQILTGNQPDYKCQTHIDELQREIESVHQLESGSLAERKKQVKAIAEFKSKDLSMRRDLSMYETERSVYQRLKGKYFDKLLASGLSP